MATITNLTNTKWLLGEFPVYDGGLSALNEDAVEFNINFTTNETSDNNCTKLIIESLSWDVYDDVSGTHTTRYTSIIDTVNFMKSSITEEYSGFTGGWINDSVRYITITGGTDVTNENLINWLEAYSALIPDNPNTVQLTYENAGPTTHTMSFDGGFKHLYTQKKIMRSDLDVEVPKVGHARPTVSGRREPNQSVQPTDPYKGTYVVTGSHYQESGWVPSTVTATTTAEHSLNWINGIPLTGGSTEVTNPTLNVSSSLVGTTSTPTLGLQLDVDATGYPKRATLYYEVSREGYYFEEEANDVASPEWASDTAMSLGSKTLYISNVTIPANRAFTVNSVDSDNGRLNVTSNNGTTAVSTNLGNLSVGTNCATISITTNANGGSTSIVDNSGTAQINTNKGTVTVTTNNANKQVSVNTNNGNVEVTSNAGLVNVNGGAVNRGVQVNNRVATVDGYAVTDVNGDLKVPTYTSSITALTFPEPGIFSDAISSTTMSITGNVTQINGLTVIDTDAVHGSGTAGTATSYNLARISTSAATGKLLDNGAKVSISSTTPTSPSTGDIWLKI